MRARMTASLNKVQPSIAPSLSAPVISLGFMNRKRLTASKVSDAWS